MFGIYFEVIAYLCFTISIIILIIHIGKLYRVIADYINHVNAVFCDIKNNIKDIKENQAKEINGLARMENKIDTLYRNDVKYYKFVKKVDEAFFNKNMINKGDVAFVGVVSKVQEKEVVIKDCLFADLDGTLIETKSGNTFPKNETDWKFKEDVIGAIEKYNPKYLFIISNQGGIEKGFIDENDFILKIEKIKAYLKAYLPNIKRIEYDYCTSNDKNFLFRKPNTGMIDRLVERYNININSCIMIGDASGKEGQFSDSDKKCAEHAGIEYMDVEDFVNKYK